MQHTMTFQLEDLPEVQALATQPLAPRDEAPAASEHEVDRGSIRQPLTSRLVAEIRDHAVGYSVLAVFTLAGPVVTHFLFPEAPLALGIIGGLAFGGYATFCAVFDKFL